MSGMTFLYVPTWILWAIPAGFFVSVVCCVVGVIIHEQEMKAARQQIRAARRVGRDEGWRARGRATQEYMQTRYAPLPPAGQIDPATCPLGGTIIQ